MPESYKVDNRTALITGAAKRIGKAVSMHLAQGGWSLALHYNKSADSALEMINELRQRYPNSRFELFQGDLATENYALNLVSQVVDTFGNVDLLINNASIFEPGTIKNISVNMYKSHMDVNLKAPVLLISEYCHICKRGCVVNMLDTRITGNQYTHAAYSISKKALAYLTQMAALELAPDFRVNGVAPGATLPPEHETEQYLQRLEEKIPMGSSGGVNMILNALDFIIYNPHVTGQIFYCDGGEHLL